MLISAADPFWQALLLTLIAGLSTGLGALVTLALPRSDAFLARGMAFSAGTMVAVSFVELLPQTVRTLGMGGATVAFLLGALSTFALDVAVPHLHAAASAIGGGGPPSGLTLVGEGPGGGLKSEARPVDRQAATRVALVATLAIALHNFPEGFAVFAGAFQSLELGVVLAIAVAAHNIPEGMAVAAPVLRATGSRTRAFWAGMGSGLLEPIGAVVGGLVLYSVMAPAMLSGALAFVAGVMVYVSLDELLPAAREQAHEHEVAASMILGIAFMLMTLALLSP